MLQKSKTKAKKEKAKWYRILKAKNLKWNLKL